MHARTRNREDPAYRMSARSHPPTHPPTVQIPFLRPRWEFRDGLFADMYVDGAASSAPVDHHAMFGEGEPCPKCTVPSVPSVGGLVPIPLLVVGGGVAWFKGQSVNPGGKEQKKEAQVASLMFTLHAVSHPQDCPRFREFLMLFLARYRVWWCTCFPSPPNHLHDLDSM
jgi:hypothetical protein